MVRQCIQSCVAGNAERCPVTIPEFLLRHYQWEIECHTANSVMNGVVLKLK